MSNIHKIEASKFKTNTISIRFATKLTRENITSRALLPSILYSGCKKYPTKRLLTLELEKLYDASIGFSMTRLGALSVISIDIIYISDRYLPKSIEDRIIDLLEDVILNPLVDENGFMNERLQEEKRLLEETIKSIDDDKTDYALKKLKEHMYKDENFGILGTGYIEDFSTITTSSLYDEYVNMINCDFVDVIVSGDVNTNRLERLFSNSVTTVRPNYEFQDNKDVIEYTVYNERQNIKQSKLNIGYRCGITQKDDEYFAMVVLNSLLGSAPNNILFQTVREENSLCYYIRSSYLPFKGTIHIYLGIKNENYKKALELISAQILRLVNGDFSEKLLINAKKYLINNYKELFDRQMSIVSKAYYDVYLQRNISFDDMIKRIQDISRIDIMEAAKAIVADTEFYLIGAEDE